MSPFDGNYISPAIFREMLKRVFNIRLSGAELGALVDMFDTGNPNLSQFNPELSQFNQKLYPRSKGEKS
jgi:hypothetical protein